MRHRWWFVRGAVGAVIGLAVGAMGGDLGIMATGGIIGLALGLGFPDRNQGIMGSRPPAARAEEETADPEVWPPPPRATKGH